MPYERGERDAIIAHDHLRTLHSCNVGLRNTEIRWGYQGLVGIHSKASENFL